MNRNIPASPCCLRQVNLRSEREPRLFMSRPDPFQTSFIYDSNRVMAVKCYCGGGAVASELRVRTAES
jgi:hypothetical protein